MVVAGLRRPDLFALMPTMRYMHNAQKLGTFTCLPHFDRFYCETALCTFTPGW